MKPHELISELVRRTGKSTLAVATEMAGKGFQGTLHKFMAGSVSSPSRATAERIARYFGLEVDVIYDSKKATAEAARRGVDDTLASRAVTALREPTSDYLVTTTDPLAFFSQRLRERLTRLTRTQAQALEQLVHAHLDAIGIDACGKQTGANRPPLASSG